MELIVKLTIYQAISSNLDVNENDCILASFANKEEAIQYLHEDVVRKGGKDIMLDLEGLLEEYEGKSLDYQSSHHEPAIYYRSDYGNYRCARYVRAVSVY